MRILALETTERVGSVAVLEAERLLAELRLDGERRTAQTLVPAIRDLLREFDWSPMSLDLVAVTIGPGSFTGLRVGVTTAKTLAYAASAEVIGVATLEAIAGRAPSELPSVEVVLDAERREVFAGRYSRDAAGRFTPSEPLRVLGREAWLAQLEPGDCVTGPALRRLAPKVPAGVQILDESLWSPMASTVGRLAWRQHQTKGPDDLWQLKPQYFRKSAAEEKWDQTQPKRD